LGPFIFYLLLPGFVGMGVFLAIAYTVYEYLTDLLTDQVKNLPLNKLGMMFEPRPGGGFFASGSGRGPSSTNRRSDGMFSKPKSLKKD